MQVVLGNRNAVHSVKKLVDDEMTEVLEKMPRGKRATTIDFDEGVTLASAFKTVTDPRGVWANHATDGASPAWVASDSPGLAAILAEHFGGIEVRDLGVDNPTPRSGRGGAAASVAGTALMLGLMLWLLARLSPFLKTNAGNDFVAKQLAGAASATAVAKWMGITANATVPSASDTSLTAEITTAGGGLIRAAGAYAHTTGAASYTVTNTFTANGSDSLPVTIAKAGVFDAVTAGNLVFETAVSPTATLSAPGDALTLTQTVSL